MSGRTGGANRDDIGAAPIGPRPSFSTARPLPCRSSPRTSGDRPSLKRSVLEAAHRLNGRESRSRGARRGRCRAASGRTRNRRPRPGQDRGSSRTGRREDASKGRWRQAKGSRAGPRGKRTCSTSVKARGNRGLFMGWQVSWLAGRRSLPAFPAPLGVSGVSPVRQRCRRLSLRKRCRAFPGVEGPRRSTVAGSAATRDPGLGRPFAFPLSR